MDDLPVHQWVVAVDPGSVSTGVALACRACPGDGSDGLVESWSVRPPSGRALDPRLRFIGGGLETLFTGLMGRCGGDVLVVVEDGVYRARPKVCSTIGEVRGLVFANACRAGWLWCRMSPMSWKVLLTKAERQMPKDGGYVSHWNNRKGWSCRTADEVDARLIALRALGAMR